MANSIKYSFTVIVALHKMQEELLEFLDWINKYNNKLNRIFFIVKDSGFNKKILENINYLDNLKIITKKDNSIYEAWNQSIDYVPTEYVIFLGITDRITHFPNDIDKFFNAKDLVYFDFLRKDSHSIKVRKLDNKYTLRGFPINMNFCFSSCLIKKEFLIKNKFCVDYDYKIIGDLGWLLRNLNIIKCSYIHIQPFVIFEAMGMSNSPNYFKKRLEEYRIITRKNKYNILHYIFYYFFSLIKIIF